MTQQKNELVEMLISLSDNEKRAELSALRKGASDPFNNFEALRIVGPKIHDDSDQQFKNAMLLATLFAIHPKQIKYNNENQINTLGTTLRKARSILDFGQDSLDARFTTLLNTDFEDLPHLLVQIFRYLANKDIPVDYYQLAKDIEYWTHPDKFVQFSWAKDYWTSKKLDETNNNENNVP